MSQQCPVRNQIYTLHEIYKLDLKDSPCLEFRTKDGKAEPIQYVHLNEEELLNLLGNTQWKYVRTTHEWIPIFVAVDSAQVRDLLEFFTDMWGYDLWIPKGTREQWGSELGA